MGPSGLRRRTFLLELYRGTGSAGCSRFPLSTRLRAGTSWLQHPGSSSAAAPTQSGLINNREHLHSSCCQASPPRCGCRPELWGAAGRGSRSGPESSGCSETRPKTAAQSDSFLSDGERRGESRDLTCALQQTGSERCTLQVERLQELQAPDGLRQELQAVLLHVQNLTEKGER